MIDNEPSQRVVQALGQSPRIGCRDLAASIGMPRRSVDRLLHVTLRSRLERDSVFRWSLGDPSGHVPSVSPLVDLPAKQFIARFVGERGLDDPDGRPLYAYRCTESEFEALHLATSDLVDFDPFGRSKPTFAPLFVLYAAEWWRRHQDAGAWAWEPVFESIDLDVGNIMSIYPPVLKGLEAWRRPLLRNPHGRMFLVTLACEGGLPLQVVKTEGARLREFFRHVLEDYGLYSRSGVPAAELARRNAGYLRRSLRQEIVFELGGQLIEAIWQLQARVRGAKDAVAELDALEPLWREQLPFEVGDDVAAAFLNSLVQTAHRIRQGVTEEFRLSRSIVQANGLILHAELSFPPSVDETWMTNVTGLSPADLPQRGQFVLISTGGKKIAALNVTQRYRGEGVRYVLERLGGNVRIEGIAAADGWSIQFESQRGAGVRREVRGGAALSLEIPWVFAEADEGRWRFIGQGSVRTRFAECVVLAPNALAIEDAESVGQLLGRQMQRVDRSLDIVDSEGERFRVLLGQSEEQASVVQIDGDRFALGADDREIFQGAPVLREVLSDGRLKSIGSTSIEWRPVGTKAWRPWSPECVGRVAVRVVHADETRFLQTIEIVPKTFSVRLKGDTPTSGTFEIEADDAFHVRHDPSDDASAEVVETRSRSVSVRLRAESARRVPATVELQFDFGADRTLSLALPFPARGARYVGRGERILPFETNVSLEALELCRVEAFATTAAQRFTIDAVLHSDDLAPSDHVSFAFDLPEPRNGRISLELRRIVSEVQSLLAETDDGEAIVSLTVAGLGPNKLNVRRYDVDFELSDDGSRATLPEPLLGEQTEVELIPLWRPAASREALSYDHSIRAWNTSTASRLPGPWLLLAKASSVAIRPRLLQAEGEVPARATLAAAVSHPTHEAKTVIRSALKEMIERPLDEEWSAVALEIVKLSAELPASSFMVTARICSNYAAAVLVLIHAGSDRQLVWDTLVQAGFDWRLVPFQTWYEMLDAFERTLSEQLGGGTDATVDLALKEVDAVLSFLEESPERAAMQATWLFLRNHLFHVPAHRGGIVGIDPNTVILPLQSERTQLLTRQVGDTRWPNGKLLVEQLEAANPGFASLLKRLGAVGYQRAVIGAPLFAARCSAVNEPVRRRLRGELRRLRRFDVEWFDSAYKLALVMYLNKAYPTEVDHS